MMSGHASAKKAVQDGPRIKLGGAIVQIELDKDGLKSMRRVGEAIKKKHAEQASAKEQAAAKDATPPITKAVPTGPAADRKTSVSHDIPPPPPPPPSSHHLHYPSSDLLNGDSRRSVDVRTPLHESSRSRRTSPSPPRSRQISHVDSRYRAKSPEDRSRHRSRSRTPSRERVRLRDRSRSKERLDYRGRSRSGDRTHYRDRSQDRDGYRSRHRSRSRSTDRRRDRDDRRYSPRRRSVSRSRDRRYRSPSPYRRRRSPSPPDHRRTSDDHSTERNTSSSNIDEYRPPYSSRFRPGVDNITPPREKDRRLRDISPSSNPNRSRRTPLSDRDDDRGRSRKRSPAPRTRSPSVSSSPVDSRKRSTAHDRRRRDSSSNSRSPPRRIPKLSPTISQRVGGRPYIFVSDRDLPVRRFSSRDLGLCFKKYHPSVAFPQKLSDHRYTTMTMASTLHSIIIKMPEIAMLHMEMGNLSLTATAYA